MRGAPVLVVRQLGVFLLRVWWEQRSYRTALVLGAVSTVVGLAQFAFLGWFLQNGGSFPELDAYGGNIAAFMISGTVFTGFVAVALSSFSTTIQSEQVEGTLEALSCTRAGVVRVMVFQTVAAFIGTALGSLLMLVAFSLVLGFDLHVHVGAVLLTLVLTLVVLGGFGMAGCGVLLVTKKGDPVTWIVTTATTLLSGVLYPVSVLPDALRTMSGWLPTTVALDLLRRSLLTGTSWTVVAEGAAPLLAWGALSVPGGFLLLAWGIRTSRRHGSVAQY